MANVSGKQGEESLSLLPLEARVPLRSYHGAQRLPQMLSAALYPGTNTLLPGVLWAEMLTGLGGWPEPEALGLVGLALACCREF